MKRRIFQIFLGILCLVYIFPLNSNAEIRDLCGEVAYGFCGSPIADGECLYLTECETTNQRYALPGGLDVYRGKFIKITNANIKPFTMQNWDPPYYVESYSSVKQISDCSQCASPGVLNFYAYENIFVVNENGTSAEIVVVREDGSSGAISVDYSTSNGSAEAAKDYHSTTGTLRWSDGDSEKKTFLVNIIDDNTPEEREFLRLSLSNPKGGATLGDRSVSKLDIVDDDADTTPPSTITDLTATTGAYGAVKLDWTAPGDDGSWGTAHHYEIKYYSQPITGSNWNQATSYPQSIMLPNIGGTRESISILELKPGQTYYFAVVAVDEAGNRGGVSNSPSAIAGEAQSILCPSINTGALKNSQSIHGFKVNLIQNRCVSIILISKEFDTQLYLSKYAQPENVIAESNFVHAEFGTNSRIVRLCDEGTDYLIKVASNDSKSGDYTLVVRDGSPGNGTSCEAISICNYVKNNKNYPAVFPGPTWDVSGPYNYYTYENANDWVVEDKTLGGETCTGRCGARCKFGWELNPDQLSNIPCLGKHYTKDCLDHDSCAAVYGTFDERCNHIFDRCILDCHPDVEECGTSEVSALDNATFPANSDYNITATKSATFGPNVNVEPGANVIVAAPTVTLKGDARSKDRADSAVGFHAKAGSHVRITTTPVPTNGLLAHYKLDGSAIDSSGNGNDGTEYSVTYAVGNNGQAASFDGKAAYINIAKQLLSNNDNFTISFWIKSSGVQDPLAVPISQGHSDLKGFAFQYGYPSANSLSFIWGDEAAWRHLDFDCLKSDTTWHFLAATKGGNTIRIFKDGNLHKQTSSYPLIFGSYHFNIGRDTKNTDYDNRSFSGYIDDVRIYNHALSESEIKSLYKY